MQQKEQKQAQNEQTAKKQLINAYILSNISNYYTRDTGKKFTQDIQAGITAYWEVDAENEQHLLDYPRCLPFAAKSATHIYQALFFQEELPKAEAKGKRSKKEKEAAQLIQLCSIKITIIFAIIYHGWKNPLIAANALQKISNKKLTTAIRVDQNPLIDTFDIAEDTAIQCLIEASKELDKNFDSTVFSSTRIKRTLKEEIYTHKLSIAHSNLQQIKKFATVVAPFIDYHFYIYLTLCKNYPDDEAVVACKELLTNNLFIEQLIDALQQTKFDWENHPGSLVLMITEQQFCAYLFANWDKFPQKQLPEKSKDEASATPPASAAALKEESRSVPTEKEPEATPTPAQVVEQKELPPAPTTQQTQRSFTPLALDKFAKIMQSSAESLRHMDSSVQQLEGLVNRIDQHIQAILAGQLYPHSYEQFCSDVDLTSAYQLVQEINSIKLPHFSNPQYNLHRLSHYSEMQRQVDMLTQQMTKIEQVKSDYNEVICWSLAEVAQKKAETMQSTELTQLEHEESILQRLSANYFEPHPWEMVWENPAQQADYSPAQEEQGLPVFSENPAGWSPVFWVLPQPTPAAAVIQNGSSEEFQQDYSY